MKIQSLTLLFLLIANYPVFSQVTILNRPADKTVTFGNGKLKMMLDYDLKCVVKNLEVNGKSVVTDKPGIFSGISTANATFSTLRLTSSPTIETGKNSVTIRNISYGDAQAKISETWKFLLTETDVKFEIERKISNPFIAEEAYFPAISFDNIDTWDGAFLDYGGLAWFYLFNEKLCTYGIHSSSSSLWNSASGNGLTITASSPGKQVVSKFMRSADDELVYSFCISEDEMKYRYDKDKRMRFIRKKTDVWDAFRVPAGTFTGSVTFSWFNYNDEYNRGFMAGINGKQVTTLLNTAARIGVIDSKLFGGNSWHTPYGPVCLHEQYIAQLGIAINDNRYLEGYRKCLDYYRDKAIQPDGRVLPRWAYLNEDAMPGKINSDGFYEAQWGYLLDSNPDLVTNISELYHQNGDLGWVRTHKASCEKALEYMLKRDSNGNHLVEVMTNNHSEKRGSDWIDIIWASWENAFINAKLYYALTLWTDIEKQLGDQEKANYYSDFASQLKISFNKSTDAGGFWDQNNKWYVYWIDKDKSIHGNNLTVPVNFMAIAYGICDDELKRNAILDKIEDQMQKEDLFAWPLCLYSYAPGEGNDWQFPFPNYENGDIFLSWGAVGVEAYAKYKPELALKYIENILARYEKDGLAFQRYGRLKQDGLGDDILSGNSLAIVGLYKSIYGINPMYNRMYLNPHITDKLYGTKLNYAFRGEKLVVDLEKGRYSVSNGHFNVISANDFGFNCRNRELEYFNSNSSTCSLRAELENTGNLTVEILKWDEKECSWNQKLSSKTNKVTYSIFKLKANSKYVFELNGKLSNSLKSDANGCLTFEANAEAFKSLICIRLQ